MTRFDRFKTLVVVVALLASLGAACGSDKDKDAKVQTPSPDLPKAISDTGVLRVGSDIEYAPIEFYKEGTETVQGVDFDLATAMATDLGIKVRFINDTDFAGIIGALNSGRFDIVMSAMNDTKERQNQVDFVDYFLAGTSMIVQKGNPKKITTVDDLCGHTAAVQKGTIQDTDILTPQIDKCATKGKALNLLRFEKDTDALQQVKNGRAVANMEDFPVAAYNAKISGGGKDYEVVGKQIGSGPYGIAVPKNSDLLRLLQKTLKKLIADGTYDEILAKWGVADGALKTAAINGGA
jgi:polar amino acid transport system substrate-binding protein